MRSTLLNKINKLNDIFETKINVSEKKHTKIIICHQLEDDSYGRFRLQSDKEDEEEFDTLDELKANKNFPEDQELLIVQVIYRRTKEIEERLNA
jgi:hypothetical protein